MRDLSESVNACVGSSRTADLYFSLKNISSRFEQFALHGSGIRLFLPASVARAFVFD